MSIRELRQFVKDQGIDHTSCTFSESGVNHAYFCYTTTAGNKMEVVVQKLEGVDASRQVCFSVTVSKDSKVVETLDSVVKSVLGLPDFSELKELVQRKASEGDWHRLFVILRSL